MLDYSSMSNSALVNALLAPQGQQQQQQEREHEPRPRKQQKIQEDDEYIAESSTFLRRSTRAKRSSPLVASLDQDIADASSAVDEEDARPTKKAGTKTKKTRPVRLIRKKPIGIPVPKTLDEAGAADRMMWEWKNQGKNWEEIRAEWKKLTGVEPGGSSLSVRYIKLVENLARNGAAGDLELLRFKKEAEDELMSQLWPKVAEKMLAFSASSEHNPRDLQKRYNMIVRSGYDVEKLLEEDRNKGEAEQTTPTPGPEGSRSLSESTFFPSKADEYDNAVANATAATLCERNDQSANTPRSVCEQTLRQPHTSDSSVHVLDDVGLLQREVDGLNEIPEFPGLAYPAQNRQ